MSAPHPDDTTGAEEAPPFTDLTDERAVELLRRWAEDAQKDPATHTYFPSLARTFFRFLADEARREKWRAAQDTDRRARSHVQPVGVPGFASVALAGEEVYDVFNAVLDAVQSWTTDDHVLPNNEAHRRLLRHLDALRIMTNAVIATDAPFVQAHLADARAAEEWRHDRWMARSRPAPGPGRAPDDTATDGATAGVQP